MPYLAPFGDTMLVSVAVSPEPDPEPDPGPGLGSRQAVSVMHARMTRQSSIRILFFIFFSLCTARCAKFYKHLNSTHAVTLNIIAYFKA